MEPTHSGVLTSTEYLRDIDAKARGKRPPDTEIRDYWSGGQR